MQLIQWLSFTACVWSSQANAQDAQKHLGHPSQEILSDDPSRHTKPKNFAAILPSPLAQLEVASAPYPECGDEELIIKNHVVAINPVDWKIQSPMGRNFNLTYPVILGEDVAGEVVEVGSKIKSRFFVGDRVMAHPLGLANGPAYGGFQLYPVLKAATVSKIPDSISFEEAAVLPLSISTAAAGLFMKATLGLKYPPKGSEVSERVKGSTLLVWGCSSSVGSSVIQLAHAAGYSLITTSSPSNYEYCKALGADHVLDYHDADIVNQLISLLKGKKVVGAYDAIGSEITVRQSTTILHALGGGKIASVGLAPEVFPDVQVSRVSSGNIVTQEPEVAEKIWGAFVPWALKSGSLVTKPKGLVVGEGLENVQVGLDRQRAGVSALKVEVVLN
ncbi:oxidoreductase [Cadophora sp. MPI-SDFR-AT-0126]|nr:oxidoreductase [Leotiomycetes sp. MPI-SDFR-AT-0126]